jgi:hypothetical protein
MALTCLWWCVRALQGDLPQGFSVGSAGFHFNPIEVPTKKALMNITVIALDEPSNEVLIKLKQCTALEKCPQYDLLNVCMLLCCRQLPNSRHQPFHYIACPRIVYSCSGQQYLLRTCSLEHL